MALLEKPALSRRLAESVVAAVAGITGVFFAFLAWNGIVGRWLALEKLAGAFSSTVPAWDVWDLDGVRTDDFTASPLVAWIACLLWTGATWYAGRSSDKVHRPLWLLASLAFAITALGEGDMNAAIVLPLSVGAAWVSLVCFQKKNKRSEPEVSRLSAKPVWTALGLGLFVFVGTLLLWRTAFADSVTVTSAWFPSVAVSIIPAACATVVILIKAKERATLAGMLIAMIFACCLYMAPGTTGLSENWKLRYRKIARAVESPEVKALAAGLGETRLSEAEASVERVQRPEVKTDWTRRRVLTREAAALGESGRLVAAWLTVDEELYLDTPGLNRVASNKVATLALAGAPPGPVLAEMSGWHLLAADNTAGAVGEFRRALGEQPVAPMRWLGLALAEAGSGQDEPAVNALCTWCLLEPRAVFSPAWNRAPLDRLRPATMRRWAKSIAELTSAGALSANDSARLGRFSGWMSAWERSGGDLTKFLKDSQSPPPTAGAVRMVRERMLETLHDPTDAKICAIISASTALLADRHVNVGQCREIFEVIRDGKTGTTAAKSTIMISRPTMPDWSSVSRITEGGVGATLHDFEENLVLRLLTYGHESAYIRIPDKFLREALAK